MDINWEQAEIALWRAFFENAPLEVDETGNRLDYYMADQLFAEYREWA